jgi:hypothetical protein
MQLAHRGMGDIDYRFGDDFNWRGGPGLRLERGQMALGIQALLSGEDKATDRRLDVDVLNTHRQAVYLRPLVTVAWKKLGGELGQGVPQHIEQAGFDAVPDWRMRFGLNWQLRGNEAEARRRASRRRHGRSRAPTTRGAAPLSNARGRVPTGVNFHGTR